MVTHTEEILNTKLHFFCSDYPLRYVIANQKDTFFLLVTLFLHFLLPSSFDVMKIGSKACSKAELPYYRQFVRGLC